MLLALIFVASSHLSAPMIVDDPPDTGRTTEMVNMAQTVQPVDIDELLDDAKALIGIPYRTLGSSPEIGFDCSGFTKWVFAQSGVEIPRSARTQYAAGPVVFSDGIDPDELLPGDLVYKAGLTHVAIYLGGGQIIHSPRSGETVKIADLDLGSYTKATRPIPNIPDNLRVWLGDLLEEVSPNP